MTTQNKNVPAFRFPEFDENWDSNNLLNLSLNGFSNGVFNDPKKVGKGYRLINVKDMYVGDSIDIESLTLVDIDEKEFKKNKVENGDIFFTRSSLVKEGIAHSNVNLSNADDITFDGHIIKMRPNQKIVLPKFLSYMFKTNPARRQFIVRGKTTTMTTIGQEEIGTVTINFPTLPEQQKIAAFLTAIDGKVQQLTKKKVLLAQYKKAVMQKIFNQEIRFKDSGGNNFADWEEKKLGDVVLNHNSGVYKNSSLFGQGTNIIGVSDLYSISSIDGQEFKRVPLTNEELTKFTLNEGDLIYGESSLVREGIAKTLFVTKNGAGTAFAWHTRRFNVDNSIVNSSYLYYHLNSPKIRNVIMSVATQTALTGITTKEYFNIAILLPLLEEQQKIADFLSAIDDKINLVNQQLEKTKEYKKGLLQQMFI